MELDQDAVDQLTPAVRVEAQEYYLLRDTKRRDYVGRERRGRGRWPVFPAWPVHGVPVSMRSCWTPGELRRRAAARDRRASETSPGIYPSTA